MIITLFSFSCSLYRLYNFYQQKCVFNNTHGFTDILLCGKVEVYTTKLSLAITIIAKLSNHLTACQRSLTVGKYVVNCIGDNCLPD